MLGVLSDNYPKNEEFEYYIEPFVGAGWSFFNAVENLRYRVHKFVLGDINEEIVWSYEVLRGNDWKTVAESLNDLNNQYMSLPYEEKSNLYYRIRNQFNTDCIDKSNKVICLFFLNAAGYNGLYRKNQKGEYNVAWNKKDKLYLNKDWETIHEVLNSVDIEFHTGSFSELNPLEYENAFWYFDPPYHSNHTRYSLEDFREDKQIQLKEFCDQVDDMDSKFMLSNSNTEFITKLYEGYNIQEILTKRTIRQDIGIKESVELLVTNY